MLLCTGLGPFICYEEYEPKLYLQSKNRIEEDHNKISNHEYCECCFFSPYSVFTSVSILLCKLFGNLQRPFFKASVSIYAIIAAKLFHSF